METKAIKFDPKQWEELTKQAKEQGVSTAGLIRQIIYNHLTQKRGK